MDRLRAWLERVDPGLLAVRRAPKAAVVVTGGLAVGLGVVDNVRFALLWAFGGIAALLFARVWGEISQRLVTYAAITGLGAVAVAAGSVAGRTVAAVAVVSMVVVAFVVRYLGCVGGQVAGAAPAMLLAFTLALLTSQGPGALGSEVAGWVVGTTLAAVLDTLVWPAWPRRLVRADLRAGCGHAATSLRALAASASGPRDAPGRPARDERSPVPADPVAVRGRIDVLARAIAVDSGHFAFALSMADQLGEVADITGGLATAGGAVRAGGAGDPTAVETREVLARAADALDAVGALLDDHAGAAGHGRPDEAAAAGGRRSTARLDATLTELNAASDRHRQALLDWSAQSATPPDHLNEVAAVSLSVRLVAVLVVSLGANVAAYAGEPLDPGRFTVPPAVSRRAQLHAGRQVAAVLRINWRWSSAWMRNALRTAIALGAAVVVTDLIEIPHSFWVVLATLTVLRTSAIDTGLTVAAVAAGIAVGFVASFGLAVVATGHPWVLWMALPVAIMGAVVAPVLLGVAGGQAMFAVTVVALFNLVNDQGTLTAVNRVEAVALGMVVALAVAVLLWPRGARPLLAAALADAWIRAGRSTAFSLEVCVGARLDPAPADGTVSAVRPVAAGGDALDDAEVLATEALIDVIDQGHLALTPQAFGPVFSMLALVGVFSRLEAGIWQRLGVRPHLIVGEVDGRSIQAWPGEFGGRMGALADRYAAAVHPHRRVPGDPTAAPTALPADPGAGNGGTAGDLVTGWVTAWIQLLDVRLGRAEEASTTVAAALAQPWWR